MSDEQPDAPIVTALTSLHSGLASVLANLTALASRIESVNLTHQRDMAALQRDLLAIERRLSAIEKQQP